MNVYLRDRLIAHAVRQRVCKQLLGPTPVLPPHGATVPCFEVRPFPNLLLVIGPRLVIETVEPPRRRLERLLVAVPLAQPLHALAHHALKRQRRDVSVRQHVHVNRGAHVAPPVHELPLAR